MNHSLPLILIVIYLIDSIQSQRNPTISFISKDKVVNIGDNLELKCQAQDAESYPVSWTKLGNEQVFISKGQSIIIPSNRHQIVFDQKDSTYTLIINKIQEIDAGIYRCEITTAVNSKVIRIQIRIICAMLGLKIFFLFPLFHGRSGLMHR